MLFLKLARETLKYNAFNPYIKVKKMNDKTPNQQTFEEGGTDSRIKRLEEKVKKLKDEVDSDDSCCCGCCIGLAIGYLIFSPSSSQGMDVPKNVYEEPAAIVQTINHEDNLLLRQIDNYQKNISPKIKERLGKEKLCKYTPSCSEYAKQAIEKHGSVKGSMMATKRLLKCNPLSKGGYDPIE